jgi:[NiFe] hydrogenase assembly HybE family chaperone
MTEATPAAEAPCPARRLELRFAAIHRGPMQGMPMVNPALVVEAVGFRPWQAHWLGILVTPWFMNLWLMPRVHAHWQPIAERETRTYVFPAGVFQFIGGRDAELGDYQACSLFSPMFEFADPPGARATALAALAALFDPGQRAQGTDFPAPPPAPALSKRDFLFGHRGGVPREP